MDSNYDTIGAEVVTKAMRAIDPFLIGETERMVCVKNALATVAEREGIKSVRVLAMDLFESASNMLFEEDSSVLWDPHFKSEGRAVRNALFGEDVSPKDALERLGTMLDYKRTESDYSTTKSVFYLAAMHFKWNYRVFVFYTASDYALLDPGSPHCYGGSSRLAFVATLDNEAFYLRTDCKSHTGRIVVKGPAVDYHHDLVKVVLRPNGTEDEASDLLLALKQIDALSKLGVSFDFGNDPNPFAIQVYQEDGKYVCASAYSNMCTLY